MPFSSTFVCFNPYRISLLDKRIPVPWRMTLRRIPIDRVFGFKIIIIISLDKPCIIDICRWRVFLIIEKKFLNFE